MEKDNRSAIERGSIDDLKQFLNNEVVDERFCTTPLWYAIQYVFETYHRCQQDDQKQLFMQAMNHWVKSIYKVSVFVNDNCARPSSEYDVTKKQIAQFIEKQYPTDLQS